MALFSIIIPVYNVEEYIEKCIESLLNQTFKDFEAIFIDDCEVIIQWKLLKNILTADSV